MLLSVVFGIVIAVIIWECLQKWKFRKYNMFPGPRPLPIIGNALEVLDMNEILETTRNFIKNYGGIVKVWAGSHHVMLLISDVGLTEKVLKSQKFITKSDAYKSLFPWLRNGLLAATGLQWHMHRKLMTPSFHFKILETFLIQFDTACDVLIEILQEKANGDIVDLMPIMTGFTLDIIGETAMGININAQRNPHSDYVEAIHFMTKLVMDRATSPWNRNEFFFRLTSNYRKQQKAVQILNEFTVKVIEERRKLLLDGTDNNSNNILIDILLKGNDNSLSNEVIEDQVNTILFGGHDTTASAISLMLYALANFPEIQEKIVIELKEIFKNDISRPATMEDLNKMKYMDLVIKETLRYYTPVPFSGRELTEDLEHNGKIIPKGTEMIFLYYFIHHDSKLFENPYEFIPERFSSDSDIKPFSFLPFSAGPRNCIGQKYAVNEIKVTFAKLLRRFEFLPAGPEFNVHLIPQLVMKSANGVNVKIKIRDF